MNTRQLDFVKLAMAADTMDKQRQALVADFVHRRIDMDQFNARYREIDEMVDLVHFRYIAKYKLIDRPPDPRWATLDEVLNANRTN